MSVNRRYATARVPTGYTSAVVDPRDYDPENKMSWSSKLLLGAFAFAALTMIGVIGFSVAFSRFLDRAVENYTDVEPDMPAMAVVTPAEVDAIEQRVEDYEHALDAGPVYEPLVLSENDVNALLTDSLKEEDGTAVHVELLPGQIQARLSMRLTQRLPLGPWSRDLTGRYLNGVATFDAAVHNSELELNLAAFEVKGQPLPERVLAVLRNEIDKSGVLEDEKLQEFLGKVGSVRFDAGEVRITPRS